MVSHENQDKMLINELKRQQSRVFDRDKAAQFAKQLGVKYFITGKIHDSAEKSGSERRAVFSVHAGNRGRDRQYPPAEQG